MFWSSGTTAVTTQTTYTQQSGFSSLTHWPWDTISNQ